MTQKKMAVIVAIVTYFSFFGMIFFSTVPYEARKIYWEMQEENVQYCSRVTEEFYDYVECMEEEEPVIEHYKEAFLRKNEFATGFLFVAPLIFALIFFVGIRTGNFR